MKKLPKTVIVLILIAVISASYFAGSYITQQKHLDNGLQRCQTYISFAITKAKNEDLSDPGVMKALISNVYAAYGFCDDAISAGQLHDLWNTLIFDGDSFIGNEDILITQLEGIADALQLIS